MTCIWLLGSILFLCLLPLSTFLPFFTSRGFGSLSITHENSNKVFIVLASFDKSDPKVFENLETLYMWLRKIDEWSADQNDC